MADATPRDINIFRVLASGPVTADAIAIFLKKIGERGQSAEGHSGVYSHNMNKPALIVRLNKLKQSNFIASQRYRSRDGKGVFTLYALTKHSVRLLVEEGVPSDYIRIGLPDRFMVAHELEVTDVVRTIKREAGKGLYTFHMEDENTLKANTEGGKKNIQYPDLYLKVFIKMGSDTKVRDMGIEVDNSTIQPKLVVDKVKKTFRQRKWRTMMLCTTRDRIDRLQAAFCADSDHIVNHPKDALETSFINDFIVSGVFFALQSDFSANGLLGTGWVSMKGVSASFAPAKKSSSK